MTALFKFPMVLSLFPNRKSHFIYGILALIAGSAATQPASARVFSERIEYQHGDTTLIGMVAYDPDIEGKRPGVLVAHHWTGLDAFTEIQTKRLAELGYIAFALDMYGKGKIANGAGEASQLATIYKSDRALMRDRTELALQQLIQHPLCDPSKVAAIGYCFGGTTVLEAARDGQPLNGVVSFHGGLSTPTPEDAKNIQGKVLALHGADDPFVGPAEVVAFQEEMRGADVDWSMVFYGNAVHSFTNPGAGTDNSKGAAYNEEAARRSWEAMQDFFDEIFTTQKEKAE